MSTYLLTQINTPDYRDIGSDGADQKDLGGYTKFKYRNAIFSDGSNWSKWRFPNIPGSYIYNRGSLSDKQMIILHILKARKK